MIEIDPLDREILAQLSRDASQSSTKLAQDLGMSQSAVWRRIKRLEQENIIAGYQLDIDQAQAGFGVTVFLGVKLATKGRVSLGDFERAVQAIPEVQTIELILGVYDYRLRVVARDLTDFERVLRRRVMALPGVGQVEANVLLSEEVALGPLSAPRGPNASNRAE